MLIDAHTHHASVLPNIKKIVNGIDTFGVHPWELKTPFSRKDFLTHWDELIKNKNFNMTNFLAVGECGLDRRRKEIPSIEDQLWVLKLHFDLAKINKKPLILHCVRANADLIGFIKQQKFDGNILIHDFCGNKFEIDSFFNERCYFGVGCRILKEKNNLVDIPLKRILLETDDQTIFSIEQIYGRAAQLLNFEVNELEKIAEENYYEFLTIK